MTLGHQDQVFDGDRLRATLTWPDRPATALYVTFRHRVPNPGTYTEREPIRRALDTGCAHLHVQSRWNDWYLNDETTALETAFRHLRPQFDAARSIGFSMGGYGVLRFAAALGLDQAILISPQFSLDPDVVPGEHRYPEAQTLDFTLGDLSQTAKPDLAGVVVFDPCDQLDRLHAELITDQMPRMALARFTFGGHPATQVIEEQRRFRALQIISLQDQVRAADVLALHRGLRGQSLAYWKNRAAACRKWGKRAALAVAETRLRQLHMRAP